MSGKAVRVATLRRELGSGRSVPLRGDLRLQSIQRKPGWLGSCVKRPEQDDKVLVERQAGPGEARLGSCIFIKYGKKKPLEAFEQGNSTVWFILSALSYWPLKS